MKMPSTISEAIKMFGEDKILYHAELLAERERFQRMVNFTMDKLSSHEMMEITILLIKGKLSFLLDNLD